MFRRDLRAGESYELVSPEFPTPNTPDPLIKSLGGTPSLQEHLLMRRYGKPTKKRLLNAVDCIAVLISFLCLIIAVCTVTLSLSYAARLEYTRQIIVLGFLLGVMNQCLQRVIPYMFLLIEARYGSSSLQNFNGLLKWAPLSEGLSLVWRLNLILLLLLPLGLGVVYKRFTGGIGVVHMRTNATLYTPTVPYGLVNVGPLTAIANTTSTFMASSLNETKPSFTRPQPFGYNIIVLSNTSAAAVDGPNQLYVQQLQHSLTPGVAYNLTATVRGTVATYNATVETHRNDTAFWQKYFGFMYLQSTQLLNPNANASRIGLLNLLSASSDAPDHWNASWAFLGLYAGNGSDVPDRPAFKQTALGFDVKRYNCPVTWTITQNSMQLVSGHCDPQPLSWQYQYLQNCQFFLEGSYFLPLLGEYLNPFINARNQSVWRIPTFSVVTATVFWSRVALQNGHVPVQPNGPLESYWNNSTRSANAGANWGWNETYALNHTLSRFVPTLQPTITLYFVLALQPFITLVAFLVALSMYKTPIGRGFGMVSVLAGVDQDSLAQLSGASFSGQLSKPVGLRINVKREAVTPDHTLNRLEYVLGEKGNTGLMDFGIKYH